MKRFYKKALIFLIFLILFGVISDAWALELDWPNSPRGIQLTDKTSLGELVQYIYEWAIALGGLAAFVALVRAGFSYLTSAGNITKMGDARKDIQSALLGLVLLLSSFLILNLVNPELTNLKMPTIEPFGQKCRDCIEKWGEDEWQKHCKVECDLVSANEPDFSQGCDLVKFYNISNPSEGDSPILEIDMSNEQSYSGRCLSLSPYIYPDSGAIIFYLNDEPKRGSCIVELYDKTVCDGDPVATINYSVEDLAQLYLGNTIRRVQIKQFKP